MDIHFKRININSIGLFRNIAMAVKIALDMGIDKKIISKAITLGGSSIKDFSSSSGKKGSFQQYFSVYGRKGKNCPKAKCKGKIKKIIVANRASFFCGKCQK